MIDHALSSEHSISSDIRIDDRDIPRAGNFFEFATDKQFLGVKPYAKQLEIAIGLLQEYCPRCSNRRFVRNIPVDATYGDILDNVTLLVHEHCPRCKASKAELVRDGELVDFYEMAVCLTGDSLVSTVDGLRRLDQLSDVRQRPVCVNAGGKLETARDWFDNGVQRTYFMRSRSGYSVKGTATHKVRVLYDNLTLGWKPLAELSISDTVCISAHHQSSVRKVRLRLTEPHLHCPTRVGPATRPKKLTTHLAYLLGLLTGDGHVSMGSAAFYSTNKRQLRLFQRLLYRVFGHRAPIKLKSARGDKHHYTKSGVYNQSYYYVPVYNKRIQHWLHELGVHDHAFKKEVPPCILQGREQDKLAYLAGYVQTDGSVRDNRIQMFSASESLLSQTQVLLLSLGHYSNLQKNVLEVSGASFEDLYQGMAPYLVQKRIAFAKVQARRRCNTRDVGIPTQLVTAWIHARKHESSNTRSNVYINDEGVPTKISGALRWGYVGSNCEKHLSYRKWRAGEYDVELQKLQEFSPTFSRRLLQLFERGMLFEQVAVVERGAKERVYDLSIASDEHAFCANGLLVHNCAGQRGGKSAIVAMLVAYNNHNFLKLDNPAATFGELPGETLYANFTALNLDQVTRSLWRPIQRHLARSPWYRQYHEFLAHHGNRLGQELFNFKESFVHYRHKGLFLGVKTPDRRTLRGSTGFMGGIDEIGLFDANNHGQVKFNAQEIYTSMANSFSNLRGAHQKLRAEGYNFLPPPLFMNISSPMNKFDKITRLVEENRDSDHIFVRHYATWEMNPKISRKSLQSRFDANPAEAMRDFGAVPPLSTSAFFNEAMDFKPALDKSYTNAFIIRSSLKTNEARKQQTCGKLRWFHSDTGVPKLLTLDAGSHNNSFAMTLGHVDEEFGYPVVDAMAEITPLPNCPLNFNDVYENVLVPIIERMNVRYVAADRWQSKKLLDDLEAEFPGLITEVYSIKYGEMEHFRQDVWDGRITFPWPEMKAKQIQNTDHEGYPQCFVDKPVSHFIFQAITVQDYQGKSVEKGENLTDDLFRSTALFHAFAVDEEIRGLIEGDVARSRPATIGVVLNERQIGSGAGVAASRIGVVAHGGAGRLGGGPLVMTH